jgi:hypothetical protein
MESLSSNNGGMLLSHTSFIYTCYEERRVTFVLLQML